MKKTYTLISAILIGLSSVGSASADVKSGIVSFGSIIDTLTKNVVASLITLFATAALAAFFFGMVEFILASRKGETDGMKNGKKFMLWSSIALFVMFSIWGIVTFFQTQFGFTSNSIKIPTIQIGNSSSNTTNTTGLPDGSSGSGSGSGSGSATVGSPCTVNGQAGHYVQGNAARDYAVYCSPDATNGTTNSSGYPSYDTGATGGPTVGAACTTGGQSGHYVQGGSSRDYAIYCSPDSTDTTSNTSSGQTPVGYCPDGSPYYSQSDAKFCPASGTNSNGVSCGAITDAQTCTDVGCSWSNADGCSP